MIASLLLATTLAARLGYPADAKLLIVHADDLGVAHSVDAASTKALETGLVSSASIMVPCPWLPEIAAYARARPNADLGLHLTLTSEWSPLRWRPLTSAKSLVDTNGFMYATESEAASYMNPKDAEREIRAQIARARAMGIQPTHLDSHMGTLYQNKALFDVLLRVAREEKIPARISRAQAAVPFRAALLRDDDVVIDEIITIGDDVKPADWRKWYAEQIRNIKPGVTEMIVHLAYDDDEMRAVTANHPAWGAAWRQRDFDFVTSDEFRTLLRANHIQLITWSEVQHRIQGR